MSPQNMFEDSARQLSGQDNSFLEIEKTGLPQHIGSVAIYNQKTAPGGVVRFKDILAHLESRLHLSPIFRKKLIQAPFSMDRPYLVDDEDFDLEYHVRHMALPKPGDWRQLCILLARINARPLDLNYPLWEMYVIEGLDNIELVPSGSFALLIRIHHSVMDGVSGSEMMAAIHDFAPDVEFVHSPESVVGRVVNKPPSSMALLGRAYVNALKKPQRFVKLARQMIGVQNKKRRDSKVFDGGPAHSAERKVLTRFNKDISKHRVLDAANFDFSVLRDIKNTLPGATINDVVLSIVSGALHQYLGSKDELPSQSLTTGCPIDIREDTERGTGGNVIGFMGVNLCTEVADAYERFEAVNLAAMAAKANAKASDVRLPMQVNEALPGGVMTMAMRVTSAFGVNVTPYNTMVTNIPGPPGQMYFAGAEIINGFGIGPLVPGVGLFHTAMSTVMNKEGKLTISFWACRDMMPDPLFYRQCLIDSYKALRNAALNQANRQAQSFTKPKPKKKAKARKAVSKATVKKQAKPVAKKVVRKK